MVDGVPHLEALSFLLKPYPSGQDPEDGHGAVEAIARSHVHGPTGSISIFFFAVNLIASSVLLRMGGHTWLFGTKAVTPKPCTCVNLHD